MERYNVAIIGGGAAGLMCAAVLADNDIDRVVVLERGERVGKKLSATGNGQGNITNIALSADNYFTDDYAKLQSVLNAFDNNALIDYLTAKGGLFLPDGKTGRVYPSSKQGSSVTDLFRYYLRDKVEIKLGRYVTDIRASGNGYILGGEQAIYADKVVLATGGKAQKSFGTDGNMYEVVKKLGHSVTPLTPSLVQVKTDTKFIKSLKGIRVDAKVTTNYGGRKVSFNGDVIFTDYGVSGNAIFSLSPYLCEGSEITIDLLPPISESKLYSVISAKLDDNNIDNNEILGCILNNQVGRAVVKRTGSYEASKLVGAIKNFTLTVMGTLGFDYAQVTKGGVPLAELDGNMESKFNSGLYLVGEIVNVDGQCGGYNLQWAFSSAVAAARGIIK